MTTGTPAAVRVLPQVAPAPADPDEHPASMAAKAAAAAALPANPSTRRLASARSTGLPYALTTAMPGLPRGSTPRTLHIHAL
jgi:hypothetical protein